MSGTLGTATQVPHRHPSICRPRRLRFRAEDRLDSFWARREPTAAECSVRAQLLLLPRYASSEGRRDRPRGVDGLTRAVHHHPYKLAPTAAELRDPRQLVARLVTAWRLLRVRACSAVVVRSRQVVYLGHVKGSSPRK